MVGDKPLKKLKWILLFLLPAFTGLVLFTILPILWSFGLTLFKWNLISAPSFNGLKNFAEVLTDKKFLAALGHTLTFVGGYIPLAMASGLLLALLMNARVRFQNIFRTAFFIPVVSSWIAVSLLWTWLLNPKVGLVNYLLSLLSIHGPAWIYDPAWAMPAIILTSVWKDTGFIMVLFLAGLQDIPRELHEAARIDGASATTRFFRITLPLLSPTTFFVLVISMINSFQVFDQVWAMTRGGPAGATSVIMEQIYSNAFRYNRMGYASTMAFVLFVFILLVTILQIKGQKKWVHYE